MLLSERRRLALADPYIASKLQEVREAYEGGFSKIGKIEMPALIPVIFSAQPAIIEETLRVFEHREVAGKGATWQEALADWRGWLDKCPQSGKELFWRVPPEIDCYCNFQTDKLIWKVYARLIIVPEEKPMPDITRKLELLANLKPGQTMPEELGECMNWGHVISGICAEALAEITALRKQVHTFDTMTNRLLTEKQKSSPMLGTFIPTEFLPIYTRELALKPEPSPEPWGSNFAMNTENWK